MSMSGTSVVIDTTSDTTINFRIKTELTGNVVSHLSSVIAITVAADPC